MTAPVVMLDTNAVSDVIKYPQGPVAARLAACLPGQAVMSVVVDGELRYGIARAAATTIERRLNALLAYVPVLDLTPRVAERYGEVRTHLAREGTLIGMNDLWIAAHALTLGLILVTDNDSAFSRVPGLRVENWRRERTPA